ncbi:MAG: HAMP domain-containing sensor histidine kinase [Bacteroidota bacterium]
MKIRDRLTYTLSITGIVSIAALGVLLYFFTARFYEQQFFSRLEERVSLTELMFLENEAMRQSIRAKFLQTLDEEKEYAISLRPSGLDSLERMFPPQFAERIQNEKLVRFWHGEAQGVGRYYNLPTGEYAVVVTALDTFGNSKLNFLKRMLLFGGAFLILGQVIVYRIGIIRALKPLENKIYQASHISAERLDLRLQVNNPLDEIGKVAIAFNRMLDRLQRSFEAQRQFVRNASHEMKTPLTAIGAATDVLLIKDRSIEEYKVSLSIIQEEADRLQLLINQLLDLEKAEAHLVLPDAEPICLDQLMLEILEEFPPEGMRLQFDRGLDDCSIVGNRSLMRVALFNLVENAYKYSDNQQVRISYGRMDNHLFIKITDRGVGIPQADMENIFEPFFRANNVRGKEGHGIGLTMVNKIVKLHNGSIHYRSELNKGTTCTLLFPIATLNVRD